MTPELIARAIREALQAVMLADNDGFLTHEFTLSNMDIAEQSALRVLKEEPSNG